MRQRGLPPRRRWGFLQAARVRTAMMTLTLPASLRPATRLHACPRCRVAAAGGGRRPPADASGPCRVAEFDQACGQGFTTRPRRASGVREGVRPCLPCRASSRVGRWAGRRVGSGVGRWAGSGVGRWAGSGVGRWAGSGVGRWAGSRVGRRARSRARSRAGRRAFAPGSALSRRDPGSTSRSRGAPCGKGLINVNHVAMPSEPRPGRNLLLPATNASWGVKVIRILTGIISACPGAAPEIVTAIPFCGGSKTEVGMIDKLTDRGVCGRIQGWGRCHCSAGQKSPLCATGPRSGTIPPRLTSSVVSTSGIANGAFNNATPRNSVGSAGVAPRRRHHPSPTGCRHPPPHPPHHRRCRMCRQ
jgi:hypothetical protein